MVQITENTFQRMIENGQDFKVWITSPTCDSCHQMIENNKDSLDKYIIYEGENDIVSEFLNVNGVSNVPVCIIRENNEIRLEYADS